MFPESSVATEKNNEAHVTIDKDAHRQEVAEQHPDIGEGQLELLVQLERAEM